MYTRVIFMFFFVSLERVYYVYHRRHCSYTRVGHFSIMAWSENFFRKTRHWKISRKKKQAILSIDMRLWVISGAH